MTTFVMCIGWFVVAMISLVTACGMICLVLGCYEKAMERFEWAIHARTRTDLGLEIGSSAHWFSECPDTSLALSVLSERLVSGHRADPDHWREQWRRARRTPDSAGASPNE